MRFLLPALLLTACKFDPALPVASVRCAADGDCPAPQTCTALGPTGARVCCTGGACGACTPTPACKGVVGPACDDSGAMVVCAIDGTGCATARPCLDGSKCAGGTPVPSCLTYFDVTVASVGGAATAVTTQILDDGVEGNDRVCSDQGTVCVTGGISP